MIVDLILDRKDGEIYNPKKFYNNVMRYGEIGYNITRAMDNDNEKQTKDNLKGYIIENRYNIDICRYIDSVKWLN